MATATRPPRHTAWRESHESGGNEGSVPPRPAEGIELVGEYGDSGFKVAPYIARRADGQTIQLTKLLYLVAEATDGERDSAAISEIVTERYGKAVTADNVDHLVDTKLRPLGVLTATDGSSPEVVKPDQLLALKFKTKFVPEGLVGAVTTVFKPLFLVPVELAVFFGLVALDVWLFFIHGVGGGLRETLYSPGLVLLLFGLVIAAAAFHECGHATGCAYGGARPGGMGAGLYFVWPAFYTDVTDTYRLDKRGRLRTDLGGVYFNAVFILVVFGVYVVTGFEPLLLVIVVGHFEMLQQLLPFLRLDGYYVLSDLTGVPDLFSRLGSILRSLVPWREADEKVTALKPWVRVVASLWVVVLIPVIAVNLLFLLVQTPRILATAWDSLQVQLDALGDAFGDVQVLDIVAGVLQIVLLALPVAGLVYTFVRLGRRILQWATKKTAGNPALRVAALGAVALLGGLAAFSWWPNGEYKPLQEGERLTVPQVASQVRYLPAGRPGLTPEREEELGGAPTRRDQAEPAPTTTTAPPSESPTTTSPSSSTSSSSSSSTTTSSSTSSTTAPGTAASVPSTSVPPTTAGGGSGAGRTTTTTARPRTTTTARSPASTTTTAESPASTTTTAAEPATTTTTSTSEASATTTTTP